MYTFKKWNSTLILLCLFATLIGSCEAPRTNPLDPQNPNYNFGKLSGRVQTISLPAEVIPQTTIDWQSGSELTYTDLQGKFELLLAEPQDGWLSFHHPDFFTDSIFISWRGKKEYNADVYLNALPHMDSLSVYSVVLNRFPSFQKEQLIIKTYIHDRDNDIDSVFALFTDGTQYYNLPYNTTEKDFQQEFNILDLSVLSIEELVGEPIYIEVRDIFSTVLTVGQGQLKRVIHDEVIVVSPVDNIITGPSPTLEWQSLEAAFSFHYDLEIYTNEVAPLLVWHHNRISIEQTMYTVDYELPAGSYFWVIWAIDTFGNRTRSKPAAFKVQIEE